MNKMLPTISIIIPTYNSGEKIRLCLKAAKDQNYPKDRFEIIVVDNYSNDETVNISKSFGGVKIYLHKGIPPQVCTQRNFGAEKAKGEYLFFLDHDMEMSSNLLKDFAEKTLETDNNIDAWYVPERIIGTDLLGKIRNFERSFYNATVIDAVRIVKKEKFNISEKYDGKLSSGPADWDLDIQLKEISCKFGIIDEYLYHHEEYLSLWKYLIKKKRYVGGGLVYQKKWKKRNEKLYNEVVKKQYSLYYRLVGVFVENGRWKKVIKNFHLYIAVVFIKLLVGITYLIKRKQYG